MKKLKVTAKLFDGRVATTDGYLPLDGMLQHAYAKLYRPDLIGTPVKDLKEIEIFPLPFAKINDNTENWFFDCSFACFNILGEDKKMYNKRYDSTYAETFVELGKTKIIETRKGKFKNCRNSLNVVLTDEISWYCVAYEEELLNLLKTIKSIGKKTSQGLGKVKHWVVEETKESLSHLRPIPAHNGTELMSIRPLYFDPRNKRKVVLPNDKRLGFVQMYGGI